MSNTVAVTDGEQPPPVLVVEEAPNQRVGSVLGITKWFSAKLGFGFITVHKGDEAGKDVFVHHTGIRPLNSNYKTLVKGEYVNFEISESPNGRQAVGVTGVDGGPLMCDHVPPAGLRRVGVSASYPQPPIRRNPNGYWRAHASQQQQAAGNRVRVAQGPPSYADLYPCGFSGNYRGSSPPHPHTAHGLLPPPPPPPSTPRTKLLSTYHGESR